MRFPLCALLPPPSSPIVLFAERYTIRNVLQMKHRKVGISWTIRVITVYLKSTVQKFVSQKRTIKD